MRRRIIDVVELVTLGALTVWIVTPLFSGLAAGLTESLEAYLRVPYLHGAAISALFTAAGLILALARLHRRTRHDSTAVGAAADQTTSTKSSTDAASILA